MPSVTDVQLTTTADADPITQILLLLEKKQRNLGKRKVTNHLHWGKIFSLFVFSSRKN